MHIDAINLTACISIFCDLIILKVQCFSISIKTEGQQQHGAFMANLLFGCEMHNRVQGSGFVWLEWNSQVLLVDNKTSLVHQLSPLMAIQKY